jgi:putative membrane protein
MTVVAWVFALVAAAIHILVWAWEALLIERPGVHHGVFGIPASDVPAVRLWAFGVGFYNLFLGLGMILGVVAWAAGSVAAGRTLVLYIGAFMALSGGVLLLADRRGLGRERGKGVGGAIGQTGPALIALVAALLA